MKVHIVMFAAVTIYGAVAVAQTVLQTRGALPAWFQVRELQDLKIVVAQSVIVVMLVAFLGDVLEWERASDVVFVGGGIAMVTAAVTFTLREARRRRRRDDDGADR